jgi:hypothetical protein
MHFIAVGAIDAPMCVSATRIPAEEERSRSPPTADEDCMREERTTLKQAYQRAVADVHDFIGSKKDR